MKYFVMIDNVLMSCCIRTDKEILFYAKVGGMILSLVNVAIVIFQRYNFNVNRMKHSNVGHIF